VQAANKTEKKIIKTIIKVIGYIVAGYILILVLAWTIDGFTGWGNDVTDIGGFSAQAGDIALVLTIIILGNVKLFRLIRRTLARFSGNK
jgi:hypothetical protein